MKWTVNILMIFSSLGALVACGCSKLDNEVSPQAGLGFQSAAEEMRPESTHAENVRSPSDPRIRKVVEKTLPFLEEHGLAWIDKHQCTSCHQVPMMIWSHQAAADLDLAVDREKLDGWMEGVLAESRKAGTSNSDGIAQLILGKSSSMSVARARELESLAEIVADAQQADGTWVAGGQLPDQRRPVGETHRISTVWAILALASVDGPRENLEEGRTQIVNWLEESPGGESFEWLVVRLLYENRFGDDKRTQEILEQLLAEQNSDGGWSWILGQSSDAFATGQALYALGEIGSLADAGAVDRGRAYLLETQDTDGSWPVRSTLEGHPGVTPTSTYWGTGWASIGLMSTLPKNVEAKS